MTGEVLRRLDANGQFVPLTAEEIAQRAAEAPPAYSPLAPDNPTLSDWRVGLAIWRNAKGKPRLDEVSEKVAALVADGNPLGRIARERLEYANNVLRAQLVQLKTVFGFTDAEVEESLWRAERVRLGDLSGTWPLPADEGSA